MGRVRYRSHHLLLDPASWQLSVGDEVVNPEPKVFELLAYLMRNHGRVVTKAELLDSLWGGEVVGESVLTRSISCLRKLLAEDSRAPTFVRTVHGRGYEFVAPVRIETGDSSQRQPPPDGGPADPDRPAARADVFVGRQSEIARIKEWVREVAGGRTRLVLISGEPGVGKTRLLEESTRDLDGPTVHWARASAVAPGPPFFLWRTAFRSIIRDRSIKAVLRAFHDTNGDARRLVLGTDRGQTDRLLGWDSPNHRFRAFDAIAGALAELARQSPLVLAFDDLQLADPASLLLLEFVVEQSWAPLLVLATLRTTPATTDSQARDALARLRARASADIALKGLTRAEVEQFMLGRVSPPAPDLVSELHLRTGGNPFFLSVLGPSVTPERLPAVVRQAVTSRLAALRPECVTLLRLASVQGREFEGALLAQASHLPLPRCLSLLDGALQADLVRPTSAERYAFAHDLVREVLYGELDGEQSARAHLLLAQALEGRPEFQRPAQAALLAHHFGRAVDFGGASRAFDLSLRAGAYALGSCAYEDAVRHFVQASRFLRSCPDVDLATEFALLLDLGVAQVSAGLRDAGQETLRLAAAKARAGGSSELMASVALQLAPGLLSIEIGVYDAGLVDLLREALAQVGSTNPGLRALLLARLALAIYWGGTFAERERISAEAQTLAERVGSDEVMAAVGTWRAFALLRPGDLDQRRQLAEQNIQRSQRAGDRRLLLLNRLLLAATLLESGDRAGSAFEEDAFQQLAQETRQPQALWIVDAQRACRLLAEGRLDDVEAVAGTCLSTGQRTRDHNALLTFGVHLTLVRIEQDRGAEVLDVIRDYAARYPLIAGWRVLHAYALCRSARQAEAEAEYQSLQARAFALPDDLNWPVSMAWLCESCHAQRDRQGAALLYERLAPLANRLVVIGYGIACLGSVRRFLGLLDLTLGRFSAARNELEQAIEVNRRAGAHLPLMYSLLDHATALIDRNDPQLPLARRNLAEVAAFTNDRHLPALAAALARARARLPD